MLTWLIAPVALAQQPTEPTVIERVPAVYPHDKIDADPGETRCQARVFIDEVGEPYDVVVRGCPDVFAEAAHAALTQWRWAPTISNGEPVRAQTLVTVTFVWKNPDLYFVDAFAGVGGAWASAPLPGDPARIMGGLRLYGLRGHVRNGALPRWLTYGAELEVRGFDRLSMHNRLAIGASVLAPDVARFAITTGLGVTASGVGRPADESFAVWWLPLHAAGAVSVSDDLGLIARGGVALPFATDGVGMPRPIPEVVLGGVYGKRREAGVFGFRVEAGWRRELDVDVWTLQVGVGI